MYASKRCMQVMRVRNAPKKCMQALRYEALLEYLVDTIKSKGESL